MKTMVPLEKQSKRSRRAYYVGKRNDWNGVVPVTHVIAGKTGYDRKRQKREDHREANHEE